MKSDPYIKGSIAHRVRARRCQLLRDRLLANGLSDIHCLDVGGTREFWDTSLSIFPKGLFRQIDIINLFPVEKEETSAGGIIIRQQVGDATSLKQLGPLRYDLVFSNSVIEHVGNLRLQKEMADGVKYISKHWFIQTPAKVYPVEPHFYLPFFPYLPLHWRSSLHRRFNLGFMPKEPDPLKALIHCEDTRLLGLKEFALLFEESEIIRERLFLFTQSYTATNLKL
jgi:hypothetical protein